MNEELKIIIKAVTDQAKKELAEVRNELDDIKDTGTESGAAVNKAMSTMAKGILVAVTAVGALTAAMVKLGKSAQEVQKGFAKLNTSFMNMGASTEQATQTYKELFSFLGDHDRAIEAAQNLAAITTEEEKLAEWTNALQGAFATFGDSLPIEGLAEAANETIKVGKVTGVMADALNWAGVSEDAFNASLAQTTSLEEREALVRSTLNGLYSNSAKLYEVNNQATKRYNESQANLNLALAQASAYTTPFLTSINNLGATLLTVLGPALSAVATYLTAFIELIAEAIQWVGNFFGLFSSGAAESTADVKGYQEAMKNYTDSLHESFGTVGTDIEDTIKKQEKLKKQVMGFDELNIVNQPTSSAAAGAGGGGGAGGIGKLPQAPNPADFGIGGGLIDTEAFKKDLDEAKEKIKGLLVLVGLVAAGLATWKLANFISSIQAAMKLVKQMGDGKFFHKVFGEKAADYLDDIKLKLKNLGGTILIIAGAVLLVQGYMDAWANGIDWGNMALMISGIGLAVGGVALAFGPLAAAIATIVGGIALLVIGIKDLVTNGYSMEAVITVLIGVLLIAVGVMWAFNAALLANPITWIVIAIAALVAAFVILWNEVDAFKQFWVDLWDGIVAGFEATVEWLGDACKAIGQFFVDAWNAIKKAWSAVVKFFKDVWQGIKNAFSAVGSWFRDIFKAAADGIKKAFSSIISFFKGIWNNIKKIFSDVGSAISKAITGAVKQAVNAVLGTAVKAINGFISAINFAIGAINLIPGVNISKLSKLSVPKLATGGIVDSATLALVGERGKEAVLPLENNTGWMDTLADKIAARSAGPSKIVLMLDGRELGYATINSINNITRQTGKIQLAIV